MKGIPMLYGAREGQVSIQGTTMDYIMFGRGEQPLVILPGLSDGLKTVRGQAATLALYYRQFAKQLKMYIFSRKNVLEEGCTITDMANDLKLALDQLGIRSAYVMGVSQGGMIAQRLAIQHPVVVDKLVLAVSASMQNETLQTAVRHWIHLAEANDYRSLMVDTCEHTYSPKTLRIYRLLYPIITRIGKPKDFRRFLIQAHACLTHDTYDELESIQCPTLILGGNQDKVVGADASPEMAARIPGSQLVIYPGLGHAAYEESKEFNRRVMAFLLL